VGVWNELLRGEYPFSQQPFLTKCYFQCNPDHSLNYCPDHSINECVALGTPFTALQALDQRMLVSLAVECSERSFSFSNGGRVFRPAGGMYRDRPPFQQCIVFLQQDQVFVLPEFNTVWGDFSFKWNYNHVWAGILLAFIVGFPIHYFRVRKTEVE
jgi:hypothetical protein